jgi:HTH-type transcriptional regulator, transcriptional repressor of NAD biosynthesis genes
VIVDTDAFATSLFHELYVGYRAPELDAYLRNYDLYLLTSIDTPFQMDTTGLRYDGDTRAFMDTTYHRHAEESGRPWVTLQGPPQERLRAAVDAVSTMLARYAGPAALTDLRAPAPVRVAAR